MLAPESVLNEVKVSREALRKPIFREKPFCEQRLFLHKAGRQFIQDLGSEKVKVKIVDMQAVKKNNVIIYLIEIRFPLKSSFEDWLSTLFLTSVLCSEWATHCLPVREELLFSIFSLLHYITALHLHWGSLLWCTGSLRCIKWNHEQLELVRVFGAVHTECFAEFGSHASCNSLD